MSLLRTAGYIGLWIVGLWGFLPWTPVSAQRDSLVIFAAASLTDAFEALGEAFEATHPEIGIVFNFAGSSTLAAQIIEGAQADLYASANIHQMRLAQEAGRIAGEPVEFVYNRLIIAVPNDNPAGITHLRDLARSNLRIVTAAPQVPIRVYMDSMLTRLASLPTYGRAFRTAVLNNIVSEEDSVRQVLLKIVLGEADAGVVYESDLTPSARRYAMNVSIPAAVNPLAAYHIAVVDGAPQPEMARLFINFVLSNEGQDILQTWGFIPARPIQP